MFWLLWFPDSWLPSLCCSEIEDSIDIELNSENSVQLRLCFLFFSHSHRESTYCTLLFNCVQVQTLPTAQVTLALTDFFSWDYDPYTHACEARPLTTVGWISLSVIVIVIVSMWNVRYRIVVVAGVDVGNPAAQPQSTTYDAVSVSVPRRGPVTPPRPVLHCTASRRKHGYHARVRTTPAHSTCDNQIEKQRKESRT